MVSASRWATSRSSFGGKGPLVGVHQMDLERDTLRPGAAELGGRDTAVKEQGSPGARTRLGQHLRRQHTEREPGIANAIGEFGERLAFVEIRGVNDVSGGAELIGEGAAPGGQSLRMLEQQKLGHVRSSLTWRRGTLTLGNR